MSESSKIVRTPLMAFVMEFLEKRRDAGYDDVKEAATAAGFKVAPVVYGNARRFLGISGGKPKARAPKPGARRGRPRKGTTASTGARGRRASPSIDLSSLTTMVSEFQATVRERDRAVEVLRQIARLVSQFA